MPITSQGFTSLFFRKSLKLVTEPRFIIPKANGYKFFKKRKKGNGNNGDRNSLKLLR